MIWIIPLAIVAIVCNATMDEIRFHWNRIFELWFGGTKIKLWLDPAASWTNKYFSSNKFIQWIFMSPLVFVTDFWHLLKFTMLNCIYGIIIILADTGIHWAWMLVGMNIAWGFIYEFTSGVFGVLSDKKEINGKD